MTYELKCGHVVDELRKLPAGSVHCVITSPPYYGLRSYGTPPQVWDGDPECAHDFGDDAPRPGSAARNGEGGNSCFAGREDKAEINAGLTTETQREKGGNETPPPRQRSENDVINPDSKQATNRGAQYDATGGAICSKCGAWRGRLGLEPTPDLFVQHLVQIFREVRRVLRKDGTFWLNLGDSYARAGGWASNDGLDGCKRGESGRAKSNLTNGNGQTCPDGLKSKDLIGIPWRVALALQADGWWLRSDIIWHKPNPMPESCRDRCTRSHEYVFMLTKSAKYYYDWFAIREPVSQKSLDRAEYGWDCDRPSTKNNALGDNGGIHTEKMGDRFVNPQGRNKRDVWTVSTRSFKEAHFATFPAKLIEPMILAGTSDTGCCPTCGAPWERIIKTTPKGQVTSAGCSGQQVHPVGQSHDLDMGPTDMLGWRPTCKCDIAEVVPCTVLDPFNGAATTGIVALRHGRNYIGIELKPEYVEMSRRRIEAELAKASLFAGNR